jgi:hypothetical protein
MATKAAARKTSTSARGAKTATRKTGRAGKATTGGKAPRATKKASATPDSGKKRSVATPADQDIVAAHRSLTRAARTEAQLRRALRKHKKDVAGMKSEVKGRRKDIKQLQGVLADVKKARKTATAKLQKADAAAVKQAASPT